MNKQPFYHSACVLFTATDEVDRAEFTRLLRLAFSKLSKKLRGAILADTIECEQMLEPEPGDPADLMGDES